MTLLEQLQASKQLALREAEEAIQQALNLERQAEEDRVFIRRASAEWRAKKGKMA